MENFNKNVNNTKRKQLTGKEGGPNGYVGALPQFARVLRVDTRHVKCLRFHRQIFWIRNKDNYWRLGLHLLLTKLIHYREIHQCKSLDDMIAKLFRYFFT